MGYIGAMSGLYWSNARFVIAARPTSGSLDDGNLPMRSHRFIICRTWNLAEFELMYALLAMARN